MRYWIKYVNVWHIAASVTNSGWYTTVCGVTQVGKPKKRKQPRFMVCKDCLAGAEPREAHQQRDDDLDLPLGDFREV